MEPLKKYDEFINKQINNAKSDKNTELFLEGKITIKEWERKFNYNINESKIGDLLQSKVYPVLKTLKNKIKTVGKKGIIILSKIFKFIATFAAKRPILAKILIIILIFFVIGIVSVSAATGTDPNTIVPNTEVLNAAIGFIEDVYKDGTSIDLIDKMQVQAYLVDLRNDGVMDDNWSEHIQKMGDVATKLMTDYKEENPTVFTRLVEFGSEVKNYVYTQIDNLHILRLK